MKIKERSEARVEKPNTMVNMPKFDIYMTTLTFIFDIIIGILS